MTAVTCLGLFCLLHPLISSSLTARPNRRYLCWPNRRYLCRHRLSLAINQTFLHAKTSTFLSNIAQFHSRRNRDWTTSIAKPSRNGLYRCEHSFPVNQTIVHNKPKKQVETMTTNLTPNWLRDMAAHSGMCSTHSSSLATWPTLRHLHKRSLPAEEKVDTKENRKGPTRAQNSLQISQSDRR